MLFTLTCVFNPFAPRVSYGDIIWCVHSNETLLAVLSRGANYIYIFYKMKFGTCLEFSFWALLGVKGLRELMNVVV